jgi:hypothetical protein
MGLTIFITCLGFVLSTMPRFQRQPGHCRDPVCLPGPDSACPESICPPTQIPALFWVEAVTVGIFTIDYVLRLACVHAVPERLINPQNYLHQVGGPRALQEPSGLTKTLSFTIQWMNIIDLLSFLPFYLGLKLDFGEENFVFLRLLRVMVRGKGGREGGREGRTCIYVSRAFSPVLILFIIQFLRGTARDSNFQTRSLHRRKHGGARNPPSQLGGRGTDGFLYDRPHAFLRRHCLLL